MASEAITVALSSLMAQHPFFATLLYRLCPHGVEEDTNIPTACTNGNWIKANPKWMEKLSLEERRFVIAHEVMHVVFDHPNRGKLYHDRGFGPDLKPWSHQKFNKAGDYVINDLLHVSNVGRMPEGGLHRPDVNADDLVDDVYRKIPDDDDQENFDSHEYGEGGEPRSDDEVKSAIAAAASVAKMQGDLPAGLERFINGILQPKIPWQEKLRNFVIAATGHDAQTWQRPNRRRIASIQPIYWPGSTGYNCGPCAVIVDTSGSVSEQELQAFMSEMAGIMTDARPEKLHILWVDAEVAGVDTLETDDVEQLTELTPKGGGGTDMTVGLDYIEQEGMQVDQAIVLTDGYTPFGKPRNYPVMWVSTSDHNSDWGERIKLEV